MRDYEVASTRALTQEFILSFDAGEDATEGERKARPATVGGRRKGAYYAQLGGAIQLRKRRPKVRWPRFALSRPRVRRVIAIRRRT